MSTDTSTLSMDKVRELGSGMKDYASRGLNTVSGSAHAAQRHLSDYAHTTGRYVAEHPMKSALIAAAVGAAVAGVVLAMRHNRRIGSSF
jgi:ElaB/YqjD/DUF883 family membrane-anchored ribosome-binding protein